MKTMDIILAIVGVIFVAFTAVMIWLFYRTGATPDTLITCVFALLGGECGIMGWIKNVKEKNKEREWQLADEERARQHEESQNKTDEP